FQLASPIRTVEHSRLIWKRAANEHLRNFHGSVAPMSSAETIASRARAVVNWHTSASTDRLEKRSRTYKVSTSNRIAFISTFCVRFDAYESGSLENRIPSGQANFRLKSSIRAGPLFDRRFLPRDWPRLDRKISQSVALPSCRSCSAHDEAADRGGLSKSDNPPLDNQRCLPCIHRKKNVLAAFIRLPPVSSISFVVKPRCFARATQSLKLFITGAPCCFGAAKLAVE